MNSEEQYRLFQTLYDQIDSQIYPEIYPEQVFDFLNMEQDRWMVAARKSFEQSTELAEYLLPLVADIVLPAKQESPEVVSYDLGFAFQNTIDADVEVRSIASVDYADCTSGSKKGKCYLKEQTHNQRSATAQSPFGKPHPYLCYYRLSENAIKVDVSSEFTLGTLYATVIKQLPAISRTQNCLLPESQHRLLVEMAVVNAKKSLLPVQQ